MALPNVTIELQNGGLGLVTPGDDRVVGLVVSGPTDIPRQYFSYEQFEQVNNPTNIVRTDYPLDLQRQIQDFYKEAGTGAELWVMISAQDQTLTEVFESGDVGMLLDAAGGRINVLGIRRWLDGMPTITTLDGINEDTVNAMDAAQALAVDYASQHKPLRIILDGSHMTSAQELRDLTTLTYNRVAVCVGTNRAGDKNAAIGQLLGRIAAIPVNQSIGRVKTGAVLTSQAFFTSGTTVEAFASASAVHNKGYIFLRKFTGKAGYYWNDDHMATGPTDDYYSLSNGRTIDKVARLAYATYLEELLDTVLVDVDTGKIVPTTLKYYQGKIERAINLTMTAAGEISGVQAFVDPNQDILATSKLVIDLRVTPTGTNRAILVRLGLFNPLAASN